MRTPRITKITNEFSYIIRTKYNINNYNFYLAIQLPHRLSFAIITCKFECALYRNILSATNTVTLKTMQINDDNILHYNVYRVRIISVFCTLMLKFLHIIISRKLSCDRTHGISSACTSATVINALALTRAQICPKLNGKLFDSHDNIGLCAITRNYFGPLLFMLLKFC